MLRKKYLKMKSNSTEHKKTTQKNKELYKDLYKSVLNKIITMHE